MKQNIVYSRTLAPLTSRDLAFDNAGRAPSQALPLLCRTQGRQVRVAVHARRGAASSAATTAGAGAAASSGGATLGRDHLFKTGARIAITNVIHEEL